MIDVLEHLPNVVRTLKEIHHITAEGERVTIRVPYYNSWDASFDPTHEHCFNENSFEFFDPSTIAGNKRAFRIDGFGYLINRAETNAIWLLERSIVLETPQ